MSGTNDVRAAKIAAVREARGAVEAAQADLRAAMLAANDAAVPVTEIAKAADVSRETFYKWRADGLPATRAHGKQRRTKS